MAFIFIIMLAFVIVSLVALYIDDVELSKRGIKTPAKKRSGIDSQLSIEELGSFSPLRPADASPEAITAHRRQTQRYLMDMWEQRMEEETGAAEVRAAWLIEQSRLRSLEVTDRALIRSAHTPSGQTYYFDQTAKWRRSRAEELLDDHRKEIISKKNQISELQAHYNALMGKDKSTPIPMYDYKAFRA